MLGYDLWIILTVLTGDSFSARHSLAAASCFRARNSVSGVGASAKLPQPDSFSSSSSSSSSVLLLLPLSLSELPAKKTRPCPMRNSPESLLVQAILSLGVVCQMLWDPGVPPPALRRMTKLSRRVCSPSKSFPKALWACLADCLGPSQNSPALSPTL